MSSRIGAVGRALWMVLGLIVGFIGSKIFNKTGYGLLRDCLLGDATKLPDPLWIESQEKVHGVILARVNF